MNGRYMVNSLVLPLLLVIVSFIIGYQYATLAHMDESHCFETNHQNSDDLNILLHNGGRQKTSFLVVIIISEPSNVDRRNAIRSTWLSNLPIDVQRQILCYFVVGSIDITSSLEGTLLEESKKHGDLLILPVFDTYITLTKKVLETFIQINRNVDFKYLLKVDDDSYARLPEILDELKNSNYQESLYWGYFKGTGTIFRHGKWAEQDYNLCDRYLPYALGGGYVLSSNLVSFLAENSNLLTNYRNEDISIGSWLAGLKVNKIHDIRFDTEYRSRGCLNSYLVSHKQSIKDLKNKHHSLTTRGTLCQSEFELFRSYNYNWKAPPSKCCPIITVD
ncbi:beta-1,3-galactosyltransferase 6 isoform X2 [Lepeophtheirus salmonis]|uniref:beta-1,3-galactosyltransferase 6 isoform X2 n=1 Tax=Lepeophtheirus salmonis TaxID=72036 RepID=UPI001AE89409|nr:beta-1,3-galactosyltransferase 6-like [Lepeophtheirus salmonis]